MLPADVARCRPSRPCAAKARCLRFRADLPAMGAVVADFSLMRAAGRLYEQLACPHIIDSYTPEPAAQEAKPWPSE